MPTPAMFPIRQTPCAALLRFQGKQGRILRFCLRKAERRKQALEFTFLRCGKLGGQAESYGPVDVLQDAN